MALETVVFQQDPFSCYGGAWTHHAGSGCFEDDEAALNLNAAEAEAEMNVEGDGWDVIDGGGLAGASPPPPPPPATAAAVRRKKRRMRVVKNRDEVESQRMTHIAVERNRRKQMNDYLAVLRSMMPPSYVQRGDQASIIAGAINFVKELEQHLQSLKSQRQPEQVNGPRSAPAPGDHFSSLFSDFFTFPQYSTRPGGSHGPEARPAVADVEVTLVDSHANVKVLSRNRPKQLLKMVVGLHSLRLGVLHLTLTKVQHMVLYSFSVKVEDSCQLTSVNEIATAVYEMVCRIQEEAAFMC
ncbi:transcription factor bHLH96-like [Syzygium oleosum]|uniref:transcription factor bHLH96-like n=1 Tax=Syzygium oleosum TaxID=219896 RepID=UPI0024BB0F3C|nr:transcription factor bHLH96-like [Syzygium oleosum]